MSDPNAPQHSQQPNPHDPYAQAPQVQYNQAPQVQYEQAPQVQQDDGSIIALILYLCAFALVGVGLLSGLSALTGWKFALKGTAIPSGWGFTLAFVVIALIFGGIGWVIDHPVFRRNQWLWLPLLGGLGFGGYGIVFAINVWDAGGWMMYAAKNGKVETVKTYLKDKSVTKEQKEQMLRKAVGGSQAGVVRALLADGVDPNTPAKEYDPKKPQKYLMFHWACSKGNLELVKAFVEKGVKINAQTTDGWTPLHMTMFYYGLSESRRKVAEYLIGKGAKLNMKHVSKYRRRQIERNFPRLSSKILQDDTPAKSRDMIPVRSRVPRDEGMDRKGDNLDAPQGDDLDEDEGRKPRRKKPARRRKRNDDDEEGGDWLR